MSDIVFKDIIPRRLQDEFRPFNKEGENSLWMANSSSITEFMHALSFLFPEGEAFFVRSVAYFATDARVLCNAELSANVKAFMSQEAHHSSEHYRYNKDIAKRYSHNFDEITRLKCHGLFSFLIILPVRLYCSSAL